MSDFFKGKGASAQLANAALDQPTLGQALLKAGIERVPGDKIAQQACLLIVQNWSEAKHGDPDYAFSEWMWQAANAAWDGLQDETLFSSWVGGPSIQSATGIEEPFADMLDDLGAYDKAAADLVADAAARAAATEGGYASKFLASFAKHAWRGAKQAISAVGEAAGSVISGVTEGIGIKGILLIALGVGVALAIRRQTSRAIETNPTRYLGGLR